MENILSLGDAIKSLCFYEAIALTKPSLEVIISAVNFFSNIKS